MCAVSIVPKFRALASFFIFFVLCLATSIRTHAASSTRILTKNGGAVLITATSMYGDQEAQTVHLTGDVQLTFDGQTMRCDHAIMNKANGTLHAEGNLVIASPTTYVEGSSADLSYETNTGVIYDGFVKSGQVLFEGKVIRKTGPSEYEADKASYTACTTCPPAWKFSGSRINAEIGGYAYIKSSWFYIAGVPFFWLPYLIVPLKSERQTGVLFPNYEFEGEGFAIGLPFFWAISRSQDMTIEPKFYTQRGIKGLFNYRYVIAEESQGESNAAFIHDREFSEAKELTARQRAERLARSDRWFLAHNHIYTLPGGFINRAKLNFVSDLRYPRDFREEVAGRGDPALENRLSITRNSETLHSSVEAAYYINQLKADPLEGNADSVHRFPEFKQSGVDRNLFGSRVFVKWDLNYVNFAREDLAFDDVVVTGGDPPKTVDQTRGSGGTGSGVFDPNTDLIRTGQRLDIRPEISAPFRIGQYVDVLPSLQFRHTQYSFNVKEPAGSNFDVLPTRQYARGRFAIRTQMSRVYELDLDDDLIDDASITPTEDRPAGIFGTLNPPPPVRRPEKIKHEIEPEISISGIPWLQQTNSPFFGASSNSPIFVEGQPVSDADFSSAKGLQFDYDDRITQRNIVSALINNRLMRKSWRGEEAVYRQTMIVKTGTSYEFDKHDRSSDANFSNIFTIIDMRFENFDTNTSFRYFPLHRVVNTSARARVIDQYGRFLQLGFAQEHNITENIEDAYPKREETFGLTVGLSHKYASISAAINYQPVGYDPIDFRVKSWAATIILRPPGDCWGIRLSVTTALNDPPVTGFNFDYNFGGGT